MPTSPVDHPVLAVLALLSALPLGWPLIRTFLKFFWLLAVLAALTVMFYKSFVFVGGLLGLVA